ncbi:MAG: amidohydrolase family protein, partial [Gemmatimonadaceae bacterium]|nr:amidohydrolase family protein [Gemmatimonadaceae bacterium]
RQGGVTNALVAPSGGWISGQAAVMTLAGDHASQMVVPRANGSSAVAMVAQFDASAADAASRGEMIARLRELLLDVRAYGANRAAFERNATRQFAAPRADLEALQAVIDTTLPLMIAADRASDIRSLIELRQRDKLPARFIIVGAAEGWQVAKELAAAKIPVMVGAMSNIPSSFDALGTRQENPALLKAAGVQVTLISNGSDNAENFNVQHIRHDAGNAVAYGLSWDDALRAITLAPAELFGVADRIGSLRAGRDANVVIWSGDPFEFATRAETVLIRGVVQTGSSR